VNNIVLVRKYQICHGIDIGFFHFVISLFVYRIGVIPGFRKRIYKTANSTLHPTREAKVISILS